MRCHFGDAPVHRGRSLMASAGIVLNFAAMAPPGQVLAALAYGSEGCCRTAVGGAAAAARVPSKTVNCVSLALNVGHPTGRRWSCSLDLPPHAISRRTSARLPFRAAVEGTAWQDGARSHQCRQSSQTITARVAEAASEARVRDWPQGNRFACTFSFRSASAGRRCPFKRRSTAQLLLSLSLFTR